MKKILFLIFILPLIAACSAEVSVSVSKSTGGPLSGAIVKAIDGSTTKAINATDPGGSLTMDLEFGKYTLNVSKSSETKTVDGVTTTTSYEDASTTVDVNLLGFFFGIDVNVPVGATSVVQ